MRVPEVYESLRPLMSLSLDLTKETPYATRYQTLDVVYSIAYVHM